MRIHDGQDSIWWRDDEISRYYKLQRTRGTRIFVDGSDLIDYPDFIGGSLAGSFLKGFGAQGTIIGDRFGRSYFAISLTYGLSLPFELTYFEGYAGTLFNHSKLSEVQLRNVLNGPAICLGSNASLFFGIGGVGCLNSNAIATYSSGLQMGAYLSTNIVTLDFGKNDVGWDWAIHDRLNGIRRLDLRNAPIF